LIKILPRETTYVTAATGIAAVNIGGLTLHFFAGIGLGDAPKEELVSRILNKRNAKWWRQAKVLIIDEVSMIDGALFDALDYIARVVRNRSETPFGVVKAFNSFVVATFYNFLQYLPNHKIKPIDRK